MSQPEHPLPKSPTSHLHVMNLVVALLAGIISITGGVYSLKNNVFSGPARGSLQGIVRDEQIAKPLLLATVEVSDAEGAVVNTANTDEEGRYGMEPLKTGNYVVKFTAPRHHSQSKNVKIEKDLKSTINVDLVPEADPVSSIPSEVSRANVMQGIAPATAGNAVQPYTTPAVYPTTAPVTTQAQVPTSPQSYPSDASGGEPAPQTPTGYRRHGHRTYNSATPNTSDTTASGTSQNQSSGLTQVGIQLLQGYLASKSSKDGSPQSTT